MSVVDFLTSDWLAMANAEFAHLPMDPRQICRIGITVPDAPGNIPEKVTIDIDLVSGGMRFDASPDAGPGDPRLKLPYQLALRFLLGSSLHRAEAFESGVLRITGSLAVTFFVDRVLQQSKEIERVRACTANATADLSVPCWPAERGVGAVTDDERGDVAAATDALPSAMRQLSEEVGTSAPGAQLYVSLAGTPVASVGLGESRPGMAYTVTATPQWFCCAKPLTAVAIGKLWEAGKVDPFRPVRDYLPKFAGRGRDRITIAHLMTHTAPVAPGSDPINGAMYGSYETRLRFLYEMRVRSRKQPGSRANYGALWAWLLLAEIIETVEGRPYDDYLRQEILEPVRITSARNAMSHAEYDAWGDQQPIIYVAGGGRPAQPAYWFSTRAALTECTPGFMRGTMSDLGRFFEVLLAGGLAPGGQIIAPPTIAALTARHRTRLRDPWGGADWGLGFRLECRHLDPELTSFSQFSSPRSYGHDGLLTTVSFADPDAGLVVAMHLNATIEPHLHRARMIRICDAIYADLGLDG
jgi:CubicO group peptidase (beta-lactamase class C family)